MFVSVSPEEEIIQRTIQVFSYNPDTVQVINDFSVMVFLLDLLTLQNVQSDISLSCDCDTPCKVHTIQWSLLLLFMILGVEYFIFLGILVQVIGGRQMLVTISSLMYPI